MEYLTIMPEPKNEARVMRRLWPFLRGCRPEVFPGTGGLCAGFRIKPASNSRGKIADGNRGRCDKKFNFPVAEGCDNPYADLNSILELTPLVIGDFLYVTEEPLWVVRIKIVLRSWKRAVMGAAQRQDWSIG
jgi:hypothetical protein